MFKNITAIFVDIAEVVVFAVAIFMFVYLLVMQPHKIKGDSMQPNFPDGEYLLTDKVTYRFSEPKRGDVIVFDAPANNGDEYIKRIIGLPGERVSLNQNGIYINDRKLDEQYLNTTVETNGRAFLREGEEVSVPQGEYFVMGDNRPKSSDSRDWGFVNKSKITGRAWVVYWPVQKAGLLPKVDYNF